MRGQNMYMEYILRFIVPGARLKTNESPVEPGRAAPQSWPLQRPLSPHAFLSPPPPPRALCPYVSIFTGCVGECALLPGSLSSRLVGPEDERVRPPRARRRLRPAAAPPLDRPPLDGALAWRRGPPPPPPPPPPMEPPRQPARPALLPLLLLLGVVRGPSAEQEVENLSGLSANPEKVIFAVRENETTCLMAEFAARFLVPYDVWASNFVDLVTEQASIPLSRGAAEEGRCGPRQAELQIAWARQAFSLRLSFAKEGRNTSRGAEGWWKLSGVQFDYDSATPAYFKDPVNPGKHTATSHHLSALVTPAGKAYECQAQQTITLTSSDHQKLVVLLLSEVRLQPFDISSDFEYGEEHKCPVDQREQLEETLPLVLGLILGLIIVIILGIYHLHLKMTAGSQVHIPRDRSEYKHMG
uniref:lysosome-associated membrane glycoprotein 5 n=1 Tax=Euleptes europaea TaxID=460621 RepID=UPI0025401543|nr:lysosome-associated membrane glycoprotein 5 [Euleptes europaea]